MSEQGNPLEAIEAMEAAAFRTGHAVRRLLAEHADLPVVEAIPGYVGGGKTELEIRVDDCDNVRAWADRLGLTVDVKVSSYTYPTNGHEMVYEACHAKGTVLGARIDVSGTRSLEGAEREKWIADRDRAAAEGGDR